MSISTVQREAISFAKCWLHYGQHGLDMALQVLTGAAEQMLGQARCAQCDGPVVQPHRIAEEVGWLGAAASTYCSLACIETHDEARIDAYGNEPS